MTRRPRSTSFDGAAKATPTETSRVLLIESDKQELDVVRILRLSGLKGPTRGPHEGLHACVAVDSASRYVLGLGVSPFISSGDDGRDRDA
ncbi:hypothetical protein RsS62_10030 [Rhizobium dioscoreae]|uniref:hypothetical protein n=1 Tax=Rhizobium dioscoreae TaxID=2653122 RepID=UPI001260E482|nr:hypothetical protein [Rhizobium dioscoreae]GES41751.1 hypothetical protein RsS62_10030 [Rhizobium dioscoreae]